MSSVSKVFEHVLLGPLRAAIGLKIRPEQFAFRDQYSTTAQLVNLTDQLAVNANNKLRTTAIFLDVEKAFDRVWRQGLIHKLLLLDTPLQLVKLVYSFLINITFRIKYDNVTSNSRPALVGVPQNSCLSPLLYLVYTNDISVLPKTTRRSSL